MKAAKVYPSAEQFAKLAKKGNLVPVWTEIPADFDTPLSAYLKLEGTGPAYLLESVEQGEKLGRYSFLGSSPRWILESKGRQMSLREGKKIRRWTTASDPLRELELLLGRYRAVETEGLPRFSGGVVGYAGYEMVRFLEPVGAAKKDKLGVPDSIWMLSDSVVVFDHVERRMKLVVNALISDDPARAYRQAVQTLNRLTLKMKTPLRSSAARKPAAASKKVASNLSKAAFVKAVREAKKAISAGEIIQVVLSQRFSRRASVPAFDIYRALRSINPSPYMFYLNLGSFALAGTSPEILVRCEEGVVETRPIAGTRRRGKTAAADLQIEQGLKRDPKERAEHLMLADLGRNDIGRVCEYGSVKLSDWMSVERYSHVMHLVSSVVGKLRKGFTAFDVLRAAFPAGTVSGAPKVRAMQIINELEPDARGPYAGAVGYIGFSGNLDTCITIRTVLVKNKIASVQAGAGIVADSKPEREYQETCNKAAGMLRAIDLAQRGQS